MAADEKCCKASMQLFFDTRLMAMLCRHDQVPWLANMTSAGEKQYYVLALVQELFENLLESLTVGILYDIACQMH
jgi:Kyakuja-Dileera-Zisupton transposase